jgi:hydroxypyruvate reductase
MAKTPILIITNIPPDLREALAAEYEVADLGVNVTGGGPFPSKPGFKVAVTMTYAGANAALMDALLDLKLIASGGVGLDKIDLKAAVERGIAVTHTPDELTEDTADTAISLMYSTVRRTAEADRYVRAGKWKKSVMSDSRSLTGKKVGIVGLGKIGNAIARKAAGIGLRVFYTGPRPKPGVPYEFVDAVGALAKTVDILILSCPGGEATRNLIGRAELQQLGAHGFLINICRGSVVDQPALLDALTDGTIAGAGLDVYASEPNIDERFIAMENVVLLPHYAAFTSEMRASVTRRLCREIGAFIAGRPFLNVAR